jgi:RNA polymerase sigma-70 factor (ECF subfamily)
VADTTVGFQFEGFLERTAFDEEAALLDGLRRGDESAYEALIARYEHPVYSLVCRLADDPSEAPDVVQEVFVKVFRNVGSFRGDSSLKTWIYRIAVNQARNHRRWFSRHRRQEVGLEPEPGETQGYQDWLEDPGPSPFELTFDRETQELVEAALKEIAPAFRSALILREIEGLSYEQIAEVLEISLGTVKSRILRGRESLKKNLAVKLKAEAPDSVQTHTEPGGSEEAKWSPWLEKHGCDAA